MRVLDLFSGIGGFSLGLERAGMKTVAFCEIDPFCRAVLRKHWPEVPIYDDVRTLNYDGPVDVVCGGFPCQDISIVGKKRGMATGTRSGLWSEIVRIVRDVRPRFIIVENVANLLRGPSDEPGAWFGQVLSDLAAIGYDAEWENIPAAALGAPHRRERVWIVAYPVKKRYAGEFLSGNYSQGNAQFEARTSMLPAYYDGMGSAADSYSLRKLDGFSDFLVRLNQCGNAVVPQIPEMIGRAIMAQVE